MAWSGGAQAFTTAYNELSPSQQQRIGNIVYVSPGALGGLATNGSTSALIGVGPVDVVATSPTTIPGAIPTTCLHTDFACFVQQGQAQFQAIQNDGSCSAAGVFTRQGVADLGVAMAAVAAPQQYSAYWQLYGDTVSGLAGSFLDWLDSIPVGGPEFGVDENIYYDMNF